MVSFPRYPVDDVGGVGTRSRPDCLRETLIALLGRLTVLCQRMVVLPTLGLLTDLGSVVASGRSWVPVRAQVDSLQVLGGRV